MKMIGWILLWGLSLFGKEVYPYQVIAFRHAEKFVTLQDLDALLNEMGQRRAAYLVEFFLGGENPIIDQKAHEVAAFVVPNSHGKSYHYVRTTQTIIPLFHEAQAFRLETQGKTVELISQNPYTKPETVLSQILGKPRFAGKTVVICWEHTYLPRLFDGMPLAVKETLHHLGDDRFDVVWVIRWEDGTPKGYTFYQKESL